MNISSLTQVLSESDEAALALENAKRAELEAGEALDKARLSQKEVKERLEGEQRKLEEIRRQLMEQEGVVAVAFSALGREDEAVAAREAELSTSKDGRSAAERVLEGAIKRAAQSIPNATEKSVTEIVQRRLDMLREMNAILGVATFEPTPVRVSAKLKDTTVTVVDQVEQTVSETVPVVETLEDKAVEPEKADSAVLHLNMKSRSATAEAGIRNFDPVEALRSAEEAPRAKGFANLDEQPGKVDDFDALQAANA